MSEALRLAVPVMVHLPFLLLRTVVPGQFEEALPLRDRIPSTLLLLGVGVGVPQEVEVESGILILAGAQERHAHDLLVELQAGLGGLDAEHRVVEPVAAGVGRRPDVLVVATNDLHPVSIGVFGKRNVLHPTVGQFLLEEVASVLEPLARDLDVVDRDGDVSKATVGLGVAIGHTVVGVVLRSVVVRQFQHAVAVCPVAVTLQRLGTVVREEVKGELVFREVELLNLAEAQKLVEFHWRPKQTICKSNATGRVWKLPTGLLWVLDPEHGV